MMHADLIDQDDFRERLQALGFSVPPDSTPEQACEYAVRGLSPVSYTHLTLPTSEPV
ncbi:hypothetical protein KZ874_32740 [Pseudomonas aeruginosa]|uniref:hypothetical protein n=1 Tax=Pseudomonas aeruginosa TaxID=287 RepID=UPI001CA4A1B0|nr:hypothetical protein [Pseudomonas aeruginosa]MBW6287098.1 hypothetical protein [Pseudomonas aeruginosa]